MHFRWYYDKDKMSIGFCQETMSESTTHLSIDKRDDDGYVRESIELFMSIEDAEHFIQEFQNKLNGYKKLKNR